MSELTLFDLNSSQDSVKELSTKELQSIYGGTDRDHPDGGRGYERDSRKKEKPSGGEESGGSGSIGSGKGGQCTSMCHQ